MGKVGAAAACFGIWCRRLGERARAPHRPTLFILAWERAKRAAAAADDWALGALPLRTYESHAPTRGRDENGENELQAACGRGGTAVQAPPGLRRQARRTRAVAACLPALKRRAGGGTSSGCKANAGVEYHRQPPRAHTFSCLP